MAQKRTGVGGNKSRNPRGNLSAHSDYRAKFGKGTKACTGLLHYGEAEIPVEEFRQANGNKSTGLQSRCDLCNRLYFSIIQKPKVRALSILISAEGAGLDWKKNTPESLVRTFERAVSHFFTTKCKAPNCLYSANHGDLRDTVAYLTGLMKGLEREKKDSTVFDSKTRKKYAAPTKLHDLQEWAAVGGALYKTLDQNAAWQWWAKFFSQDLALCSAEETEAGENSEFVAPAHPIADFSWGSGNIKDTIQGHSVPAFNKVRPAASVLPSSSNLGNRFYGYLCEGDHLEMARFSVQCKKDGMSLGHTPAPLRWLGKNDPHNGKPELLSDNVDKGDSLVDLHAIALESPEEAGSYVSWQVRDKVIELASRKVSFQVFTSELQAEVETYFDYLQAEVDQGRFEKLFEDLTKADPGKTATVYEYRARKVALFLSSRPSARRLK